MQLRRFVSSVSEGGVTLEGLAVEEPSMPFCPSLSADPCVYIPL